MIPLYILGVDRALPRAALLRRARGAAARLPDARRDAVRRRDPLSRAVGLPDRAARRGALVEIVRRIRAQREPTGRRADDAGRARRATRRARCGASRRAGRSRGSTRARNAVAGRARRARAARANASSAGPRATAGRRAACSRRARARGRPRGRRRRCTSRRRRRTPARARARAATPPPPARVAAGSPPVGRACVGLVQCVCSPSGARAAAARARSSHGSSVLAVGRVRRADQRDHVEAARPAFAAARRTGARPRRRAAARDGRRPPRRAAGMKAHCRACAGSADSIRRPGEPPPALVDAMRARIRHRGPDQGSTDAFGPCVLGHQRLQVLDPELGYQPVANETGDVVAVFNGELYNFPELRAELAERGPRGTRTRRHAGHPASLRGVRAALRRAARGDVRDRALGRAARRLVLARDRLGKKPLVWTRLDDGTLAFASELKALLALPGLRREPDLAALDAYLALQYVPGDAHGAARRPAARAGLAPRRRGRDGADRALLGADARTTRRRATTSGSSACGRGDRRGAEAARGRRPARRAALRRDRLGVVVALMAQASAEPVRTFTVGFADERYDERPFARAVADRYATRHEEIVLEPDAAATLPRLAAAFDEPLGDEAALPLFLICEAARREVTVALVGDGGDESFAGYERYAAMGLAERVPAPAASAGARLLRALPSGRRERRSPVFRAARFLEAAAVPARRALRAADAGGPARERAELWTDEARAEIGALLRRASCSAPPPHPGSPASSSSTSRRTFPATCCRSRTSHRWRTRSSCARRSSTIASSSSASRCPTAEEPRARRQGRAAPRVRGRAAAAGRRPRQDRLRRPARAWFRGELRPLARELLLDERARSRGWFRADAVERLLDEHAAGRADHGHRLWTLVHARAVAADARRAERAAAPVADR